ncbi:MAG: alanine:cation symporter family protein [Clostridiales bacterium]|nr:alanine:cation symporter family protein [Clostridiales bacterium]
MDKFLLWLENALASVNNVLADYILVVLLVAVGLFYTIKTKFVQVRCFGQGLKRVFGSINLNGKKQKSGMSSFQAFATAVAAQVGTGNIIGACGAILAGGPGAIFWMWIIAFLGMATIYAEAVLSQKTKKVNADGSVSGGPVYYIRTAFKGGFGKFLAGFFAIAAVICLGFIGAMVQSNAISSAVSNVVGEVNITSIVVGAIVALLVGVIVIGGASRIASVTEKIVPIMAIIYLVGGIVILCFNIVDVPMAFWYIIKYAFTPEAVIGGGVGVALKTAISMGAKRGLFSNEAGMGSTPHAHAQANVKTPHEQGTVAIVSVFLDTFVVLTMTALIVITSLYVGNPEMSSLVNTADKNTMVANSVAKIFSNASVGNLVGAIFVAVCLTFFAFSTVISWNLFGRINFEYLFGKKSTIIYSIISIMFTFLGAILGSDLVWNFNDFVNYLMVIPNAIALFALSNMVIKELKENGKKSVGKTPNEPLADKIK